MIGMKTYDPKEACSHGKLLEDFCEDCDESLEPDTVTIDFMRNYLIGETKEEECKNSTYRMVNLNNVVLDGVEFPSHEDAREVAEGFCEMLGGHHLEGTSGYTFIILVRKELCL